MTVVATESGSRARALVSLLLLAAAAFSVYERSQYFGRLGLDNQQWLTGSTLKFVDNWKRDGLWSDRALMLEYPRSIENQTLESRGMYPSYLPGAPLEIYVLSQVLAFVPPLVVIHLFDLANHFAIVALVAWIVYRLSHGIDAFCRHTFAATAACVYLFQPTPYYFHAAVFFADQAIMLPFAGIVALEAAIRSRKDSAQGLRIVQLLALTAAAFIDWLAVSLAVMLFTFRVIRPPVGQRRERLVAVAARESLLFLGPLIAVAALLFQAWHGGQLDLLRDKFLIRTALSTDGSLVVESVWRQFFLSNLGRVQTLLLLLSSAFALVLLTRERTAQAATVSMIGFGACVLHTFLLRNHSIQHDFASLKFYLPLAYATFGLLPLAVLSEIAWPSATIRRSVCMVLCGLAACYLGVERNGHVLLSLNDQYDWRGRFPEMRLPNQELVAWIGEHARFEDVFVAKNFNIDAQPPQALSISRKRVYQFRRPEELDQFFQQNSQATFYGIVPSRDADCLDESARKATVQSEGTEWVVVLLSGRVAATLPCLLSTEDYRADVLNAREGRVTNK